MSVKDFRVLSNSRVLMPGYFISAAVESNVVSNFVMAPLKNLSEVRIGGI